MRSRYSCIGGMEAIYCLWYRRRRRCSCCFYYCYNDYNYCYLYPWDILVVDSPDYNRAAQFNTF